MITKDNILKVMEVFFRHPEASFHLRELERLTGLSLPGVIKITGKLEKENLLKSKKERMTKNFSAAQNAKFISLKRSYNLYSLFNSGLTDFLKDKYQEPEAIVLFGSYSRGEDISKSDIDIAVITNSRKNLDLRSYEKRLERKIEIHEIRINKAGDEFLNTLANGIVISGYLTVVR